MLSPEPSIYRAFIAQVSHEPFKAWFKVNNWRGPDGNRYVQYGLPTTRVAILPFRVYAASGPGTSGDMGRLRLAGCSTASAIQPVTAGAHFQAERPRITTLFRVLHFVPSPRRFFRCPTVYASRASFSSRLFPACLSGTSA
jgi:hypothetical protein